jgi:murein DD-endopeptidase MepM/ murein hydrolase activator NlpD
VRTGDRVVAGPQIARIGSNGRSTGCHLSFGGKTNGGYLYPKALLDRVGVTITNREGPPS